MRDTSKLIALGRSAPAVKNEIKVYSPAGEGLIWFNVSKITLSDTRSYRHTFLIMLVGCRQYHSIWVDDG
jgi:hypothetical protein